MKNKPEPPLSPIIKEGAGHFCPKCHSSMSRKGLFGKRSCDNPKCGEEPPKEEKKKRKFYQDRITLAFLARPDRYVDPELYEPLSPEFYKLLRALQPREWGKVNYSDYVKMMKKNYESTVAFRAKLEHEIGTIECFLYSENGVRLSKEWITKTEAQENFIEWVCPEDVKDILEYEYEEDEE